MGVVDMGRSPHFLMERLLSWCGPDLAVPDRIKWRGRG